MLPLALYGGAAVNHRGAVRHSNMVFIWKQAFRVPTSVGFYY